MKCPELPERDDFGGGWPPGYLEQLRQYERYWQLQALEVNAAIVARQRHDELVAAEHAAALARLQPAASQAEPPASHAADQPEQPEPSTPLEHARAIMARQPAISERDLAGALTAALGEKVGRTRAINLAAEVKAATTLKVVAS